MDTIDRICPHCHAANPMEAVYCGACATRLRSSSTALARRAPGVLGPYRWRDAGAALAVGLAALAGRAAVELLRRPELIENALRAFSQRSRPAPAEEAPSRRAPPAGRRDPPALDGRRRDRRASLGQRRN
ncbi:MAG: zinc ribbon domain-containing protein [Ardenticatenaceae bacterium]|nr:zinc ribbon domain-containing protein [Ardenticatenaceae bacterium]